MYWTAILEHERSQTLWTISKPFRTLARSKPARSAFPADPVPGPEYPPATAASNRNSRKTKGSVDWAWKTCVAKLAGTTTRHSGARRVRSSGQESTYQMTGPGVRGATPLVGTARREQGGHHRLEPVKSRSMPHRQSLTPNAPSRVKKGNRRSRTILTREIRQPKSRCRSSNAAFLREILSVLPVASRHDRSPLGSGE